MTRTALIVLLLTLGLVLTACGGDDTTTADGPVQVVQADAAVALLADRPDLTVIDVRTPAEYAEGNLAGSQMIDLSAGDFADRVAELDRDAAYLLYCRSGNRSAQAAAIMADLGFTEVYDAGGFADLAAAGAPVS